ncbi:MAG: B12-binding domain-containing radical SAM protein [Chloroflexi bacterium]|nr:MAG: B12-binding domain-containing radical SAM protein [Chloroflexota bacterium]
MGLLADRHHNRPVDGNHDRVEAHLPARRDRRRRRPQIPVRANPVAWRDRGHIHGRRQRRDRRGQPSLARPRLLTGRHPQRAIGCVRRPRGRQPSHACRRGIWQLGPGDGRMGAVALRLARSGVVGSGASRSADVRRTRASRAGLRLGRARLHVPRVIRGRQLPHQRAGGEMNPSADVVLVYPQRAPKQGRHWIMPSLGLMYLSASLRRAGYSVRHIDHTFLERHEVLAEIERLRPSVIGIYCMITMQDEALSLAEQVRGKALTVVGGPYPSGEPETFVDHFDLVAVGEGEETIVSIMEHLDDRRFDEIPGVVFKRDGEIVKSTARQRSKDMTDLPLPYRGDIPNDEYIHYWRKHWKDATTPLMSTRGCPFRCDFCHKSVFGDLFSARPVESVVAEMREIAELGYDHIWMSDDLFTLNYKRTLELAKAIEEAHLPLTWECLSRVTHVDQALFEQMHRAGCKRIFFGIESGDERVLKEMKKGITPDQARAAVEACVAAGIKAAGFFMVGYIGETTDSLIRSINFSSSLPLDYVSYTIAYPLPGTGFYDRVRERRMHGEWHKVRHNRLLFNTDFSEHKLRAAILKGAIQHRLNRMRMRPAARAFQLATDHVLRALK